MDDNKLKEYALNIYNNKRGYTFQKVYSLFPRYLYRIIYWYKTFQFNKQMDDFFKYSVPVQIIIRNMLINQQKALVKMNIESKDIVEPKKVYNQPEVDIFEESIYGDTFRNILLHGEENLRNLYNALNHCENPIEKNIIQQKIDKEINLQNGLKKILEKITNIKGE